MNCPQCKNEMVKARATNFGQDYDYCRVCKKEHSEMIKKDEQLFTGFGPVTFTLPTHATPPPTIPISPLVPKYKGLLCLGWKGNISIEIIEFNFGNSRTMTRFDVDTAFPMKDISLLGLDIVQLELPSSYEWQVNVTQQICKIVKVHSFTSQVFGGVLVP